jgi:hypothetical protein
MRKRDREKYYRRKRFINEEVERMRAEEKWMSAELSERDKQERNERIRECRYNRKYERCMTEDVSEYLGRENAKERFRCGNEKRKNRYWTEEEERRCRMCREDRETIEYMWSECAEMRERERGKGTG